jgi:hypothetical protein
VVCLLHPAKTPRRCLSLYCYQYNLGSFLENRRLSPLLLTLSCHHRLAVAFAESRFPIATKSVFWRRRGVIHSYFAKIGPPMTPKPLKHKGIFVVGLICLFPGHLAHNKGLNYLGFDSVLPHWPTTKRPKVARFSLQPPPANPCRGLVGMAIRLATVRPPHPPPNGAYGADLRVEALWFEPAIPGLISESYGYLLFCSF